MDLVLLESNATAIELSFDSRQTWEMLNNISNYAESGGTVRSAIKSVLEGEAIVTGHHEATTISCDVEYLPQTLTSQKVYQAYRKRDFISMRWRTAERIIYTNITERLFIIRDIGGSLVGWFTDSYERGVTSVGADQGLAYSRDSYMKVGLAINIGGMELVMVEDRGEGSGVFKAAEGELTLQDKRFLQSGEFNVGIYYISIPSVSREPFDAIVTNCDKVTISPNDSVSSSIEFLVLGPPPEPRVVNLDSLPMITNPVEEPLNMLLLADFNKGGASAGKKTQVIQLSVDINLHARGSDPDIHSSSYKMVEELDNKWTASFRAGNRIVVLNDVSDYVVYGIERGEFRRIASGAHYIPDIVYGATWVPDLNGYIVASSKLGQSGISFHYGQFDFVNNRLINISSFDITPWPFGHRYGSHLASDTDRMPYALSLPPDSLSGGELLVHVGHRSNLVGSSVIFSGGHLFEYSFDDSGLVVTDQSKYLDTWQFVRQFNGQGFWYAAESGILSDGSGALIGLPHYRGALGNLGWNTDLWFISKPERGDYLDVNISAAARDALPTRKKTQSLYGFKLLSNLSGGVLSFLYPKRTEADARLDINSISVW